MSADDREFTVLVGMSASEVADRAALATTAAGLGASWAFLQIGSPSLSSELHRLSDQGATRITLVGIGRSRLGPGISWLRRVADSWWRDWRREQPDSSGLVLSTSHRLLRSIAEAEVAFADAVAQARPVAGTSAPLRSPAWENVPGHRRQVFVCRGPRCSAAGAEQTQTALTLAMMREGLGDDDALVTVTGCQFPCNQAPVVSVQPEDVWYGRVDTARATRIVTEHLARGRPLVAERLPRTPGAE